MLETVAKFIDRPRVRLSFIVVGIPLTLLLSPVLFAGFVGGIMDLKNEFPFFVIACCGIAGIAAAWVRVLSGSSRLRQSPVLCWLVACGLVLGVLLAAWLAVGLGFSSGNPVPWMYALAVVIGLLLLAGTIISPTAA
ncbi:MAG: hypothetical protein QM741_09240 [Rudaea sp.]|uniref:hypothetical protein n=1 Tax=Rudaea sp. TaxID=2136325 RepID=UPI0039E37D15